MKTLHWCLSLVLCLAVGTGLGCHSAQEPSERVQRAAAVPAETPAAAPSPTAAASSERLSVKQVTLKLRSLSPEKAMREAISLTEQLGGYVTSSQLLAVGKTDNEAKLVLRIPAARLGDALERLRRLGDVLEESLVAEDVTDQVFDTEARLASKRVLETRLLELTSSTKSVEDALKVETELARVRGEIERLDAGAKNLRGRVSMSEIQVSIASPAPALVSQAEPYRMRLWKAMVESTDTMGQVIIGMITVFGALLPLAGFASLIVLPILWSHRRARRRQLARLQAGVEQANMATPPREQTQRSP
jgi:hypothetical protein